MKIFAFFLAAGLALDSTLLMLMMQQNSMENPGQARQVDLMLPLLLLDDDISKKSVDNKDLLVLMMMQGNTMGDTQAILPLLLLDDDSVDFTNFFLYSYMLRQGTLDKLPLYLKKSCGFEKSRYFLDIFISRIFNFRLHMLKLCTVPTPYFAISEIKNRTK